MKILQWSRVLLFNLTLLSLPQESGAFVNNIEKKPQKPCPKLKKYVYYISACNLIQVVVFCKKVLIL